MPHVYISIGSNIEPARNIRRALQLLRENFGELAVSSVYRSAPVGFEGDDFCNLAVGLKTALGPGDLMDRLHAIEDECGRDRSLPRFSSRSMDLDLLLYGDHVRHDETIDVPRPEITEQAFVLGPLAEIAGYVRHPESGENFATLWAAFTGDRQLQKLNRTFFDP